MKNIIFPIVHLNGTSPEELIDLRENVYGKIRELRDEIKKMGPNGRDYYPEPGLLEKAQIQHFARLAVLDILAEGIESEIEHIEKYQRLFVP